MRRYGDTSESSGASTAIVNVVLYAVVFYQAKLYADMLEPTVSIR